MSRAKLWFVFLSLLAVCGVGLRAAAADNVLKLVPSDAMGVAVVNQPAEAGRKLNALVARLQLPVPDVTTMVKQKLGDVDGIDERGSVAIAAILPDGPGGPTMVAFVPVTDFDALLKSVEAEKVSERIVKATVGGRPLMIARKGQFALVTDAAGEAILNKALDAPRSMADEMTALADRIAKVDVYAAAAPAGIKMAQQQLLAGLAGVKAQLEQQQGEQAKQAVLGIQMYESLFQRLDKELTHAVVGARLDESGSVHMIVGAALASGGFLAKMGAVPETPQVDLLADLPQGEFMFAGGGKMPQQWGEQLAEFSLNMMKSYFPQASLSDEQLREIVKSSAQSMKGMQSMSMMMGLVPADQPLYANTVLVIKTDAARVYMDNYIKSLEQMSALMKQAEKPPFAYDFHRIQLDGVEAVQIEMEMKGMIPADGPPNMDAIFKKMFGSSDTMSIYLAPRDDNTVLGSYVSKDVLTRLLKQESGVSLSRDPQVAKTLAMLPAKSSGLVLFSPSGLFKFVSQMAAAIEPQAAEKIPQFPDSPPVGMTTDLNAKRLDVDVVFPAELLQAIATFVQQAQAERQPR